MKSGMMKSKYKKLSQFWRHMACSEIKTVTAICVNHGFIETREMTKVIAVLAYNRYLFLPLSVIY